MTAVGDSVRFFFWLAVAAGEFLVAYRLVSLGLLALGVAALTVRSPLRDPRLRARLRLLAIPYAIPVAILVSGTALRYELHGPPHPNWREPPALYGYVLYGFLILHAAFLIWALVAHRGWRGRTAAVIVPSLWLSVCAFLPAGFAVAGVGP